MWSFLTFGSVHGDGLFYSWVGNLLTATFPVLPNRGEVPGSSRKWAKILRNRFVNGRRSSSAVRVPLLPFFEMGAQR